MVRWEKENGLRLRNLAARLRTSPAKLLLESLKLGLRALEALSPKDPDEEPKPPQKRTYASRRRKNPIIDLDDW